MKASGTHAILCLNSGSSSVKFALYHMGEGEEVLLVRGAAEEIGVKGGRFWIKGAKNEVLVDISQDFPEHRATVPVIFDAFETLGLPQPSAAGNRLVHGGPHYDRPMRIDSGIIETLRGFIPLAPLHLPSEIFCIEALVARFPGLPQVACFDTAFHRRMPEVAQRFPLPRYLWDEGVRRYGFHGLSFEYILSLLGEVAKGRVIVAHLGNGASMAAVKNGEPRDTTMGFSPTGGFMMSTRSGDLDPGVLVYLMKGKGYGASSIEHLVDHEAGLRGVSGISHDMKTLLEKKDTEPHAAQAVEMFCYHLRKHLGALAAVLGGIDTLVFTGGIGEKAAGVRAQICHGFEYLGIRLDPRLNESHADTISSPESACTVRVIPTSEELIIARQTYRVISAT